jgi:hypothetical protein
MQRTATLVCSRYPAAATAAAAHGHSHGHAHSPAHRGALLRRGLAETKRATAQHHALHLGHRRVALRLIAEPHKPVTYADDAPSALHKRAKCENKCLLMAELHVPLEAPVAASVTTLADLTDL